MTKRLTQKYISMKILVTGNRGFIGSNMVNMLKGHRVTTFEWGEEYPTIKGLDWVIHMGANSSTTERDVDKILRQNYDFSRRLLDDCLDNKVNFQYSSSASIYGFGKDFTETAIVDPKTPYAWTKYLFERYAEEQMGYAEYMKVHVQGFRYFNVYGPNEDHKGKQASPYHQFTKQFNETGKVKVFENSDQYYRDFVPVDQVCQTHVDFFDVKESGVWNIGTGKPKSFLDVAQSITSNIEYIPMPDILKSSYQEYTCADMTKTNETLGKYKPYQVH